MNFNRAQLKQEVKNDIRQTRPRAILVTLAFLLLSGLISMLLGAVQNMFIPGGLAEQFAHISELLEMELISPEEALAQFANMSGDLGAAMGASTLFGVLSAVVSCTLNFGYQGYCLGMVRGENPGFGRLLCALPQWGWVLLTGLLVALFTTLWTLLFSLLAIAVTVAVVILLDNAALAATLVTVAWIGAVCASVAVSLRYAMANYILLDEKTDALEAISRSKAMMRGRKWHLFVLMLSFIGWYLLVGLIAGIVGGIVGLVSGAALAEDPMLMIGASSLIMTAVVWLVTIPLTMWLNAYITGSEAKFYDWLRQADQAGGVWESDRQYKAPYLAASKDWEAPRPSAPESPETPKPSGDAPDRPRYE